MVLCSRHVPTTQHAVTGGKFATRGDREDWHPLARARFDNDEMTQEQLADQAGIARTTVARIELGKEPLVKTALRLAAVVGLKVEEIWTANDEEGQS